MSYIKRLFGFEKQIEKREDTIGTTTYVFDSTQQSLIDFFKNSAGTEANSVVFRSIKLIIDAVATLDLSLYERDEKGYGTMLYDYEGIQLIKSKPNKFQSVQTILSVMLYDVIMKGDGVIEIFRDKMGNPIELRNSTSFSVMEKTDEYDLVYTISDKTGTRARSSQDVIHIKTNTTNGQTGRSLFIYATQTLNIGMSVDQYINSYFSNGFFSAGYLSTDKNLNDKQYEAIKGAWSGYSGSENTGKTPILDNGLEYKTIMVRPNETNVVAIKQQMTADVARFFGIPLGKLNILGETLIDPQENRKFFEETLQPYINSIEQEFSNKLFIRPSQEKLFIKFNVNKYTYVSSEIATTYATFIHNAIYTPNEVRKLLDKQPLSNGDHLYLNYVKLDNNDSHFNKESKVKDGDEDKKE